MENLAIITIVQNAGTEKWRKTIMPEPKLKPCPFCGSTKLKIDSKRTFNYNKRHCSVTVRCMKCHARSPVVGINLEKNQHNERELCESQVTEAWNKRVVL